MENPIQNPVRHQEFSVLLQKDKAPDGVENLMSPEQSEGKGDNNRLEDEIYKNVIYQLEVKKIYLDPNLSLTKLSSIVGTNTTYLSNTVNRRFGMNLKALVNRYRVGHAKALMKGLKQRADIGELIRLCGFSSRSIFYSSFRREVGMTPTRYLARTGAED